MAEEMNQVGVLAMASLDGSTKKLEASCSVSELSTEAPMSPNACMPFGLHTPHTPLSGFLSPRAGKPFWDAGTTGSMTRAKSHSSHLESMMLQAQRMELDAKPRLSLQNAIKQRIAGRDALVRDLESKCFLVDEVMRELQDNIAMLKRAIWVKWAPLCVVRQRMQIRSTKLSQEECSDAWQRAMESEEGTLMQSRQKLLELLYETREWMPTLAQAKQEMADDLNRKRRVRKVDHTILLEGYGKGAALAQECLFPAFHEVKNTTRPEHPSHDNAPDGLGSTNEKDERAVVKKKCAEVDGYVASARSQMRENCNLIKENDRLCRAANASVVAQMNKHIADLQAFINPVQDQITKLDMHIYRGEIAMERAHKKLHQTADEIRRVARQYSTRMNFADETNLPRDRVDEKLDAQLKAVKSFINTLSPHISWTTELIDDVKSTKRLLEHACEKRQNQLRVGMLCLKEKREWISTTSMLAEGGE